MSTTPLAYSIPEACALTGVGRTTIYKAIRAGRLRARKLGTRTLILDEDLRRCLETLPAVTACDKTTLPASKSSATRVQS
jgi:excisionase family DNA binding protein